MTEPRLAALEEKLDAFIEATEGRLERLLAESNEWRGVRKTLAALGAIILGIGTLVGVAVAWFVGHK